jgi:Domain of unknown function DUF29
VWLILERRSASWLGTIVEQRGQIAMLIEDSPSQRTFPAQILDRCYPEARQKAALQMRVGEGRFPRYLPVCGR